MRWGKWNTGWYGTVLWIMTKQESYCRYSAFIQDGAFRKHECHLLNSSCALTRSLPDTKTAQGGPHLPLLPPAPLRLPLLQEDRWWLHHPLAVTGKATVTVSSPCPSLLGLNQQLGTSRSRSGVRWIQGKGQKSQRRNSHQRSPFPCSLNI